MLKIPQKKQSKYRAVKTIVDGIPFASKKEAVRYSELKAQEKTGFISNLILQPIFILQEGFVFKGKKIRPIAYIADFFYFRDGKKVVEDTKGMKTKEYLIKRKMFLYKYPKIEFIES